MHFNYRIFDGHCDSLTECKTNLESYHGEFSIDAAKKYDEYVQVAAIYIDSNIHNAWERTKQYANIFNNGRGYNIVHSKEDFGNSGVYMILGIEGGGAIPDIQNKIDDLYDMGIRVFGVTWNTDNYLSGTALNGKGGLTDIGRKVITRLSDMKMVIDVSHISECGFYDICEIYGKPIIASHSNSKTLCNHPRNLTDEQFKMIINKGGAVGINYHMDFIGDYIGTDGIIAHIEHFLALGGENNIGLGSDFDGGIKLPAGIKNAQNHIAVIEAMLKRNFKESVVKKIAFDNFKRVFFEIL